MVLNATQPTASTFIDNKENVIFKPTSSVSRNTNGRRPRSRTNNSPSSVVISRETQRDSRRRYTQSPPATPSLRFPVEDTDVEMADSEAPSESTCSHQQQNTQQQDMQPSVQLPRYLKRAPFTEISPAALEAVDPALKEVALEFILDSLKIIGPQLLNVAATTVADPCRDRLPRRLEVLVKDFSSDTPTHLFAVHSKPATRVSLYPVHALIFAAHCAHLPPIPYINTAEPAGDGKKLILPVVPLCLPNPPTFPLLLHYLYTKRGDHLLASLLPMPPRGSKPSLNQLSRASAATFTVQALLSCAAKVHGLWSNVAALGVFDEKLSRVIEVAWEVLLDALAISTGATWRTEGSPPQ